MQEFIRSTQEVVSIFESGDAETAEENWKSICIPQFEQFQASLRSVLSGLDESGTAEQLTLGNGLTFFAAATVFLVIVAFLISFVIANKLARHISIPTKKMVTCAQQLSQGQLDVDLSVPSKDEIGMLTDTLQTTVEVWNIYIGETKRILEEVARGNLIIESSVEFKGDFNAIKVSMNEIIHSLNQTLWQTSRTSDEVTNASEQTDKASAKAKQAGREISESNQQMQQSLSAVNTGLQITDEAAAALDASVRLVEEPSNTLTSLHRLLSIRPDLYTKLLTV